MATKRKLKPFSEGRTTGDNPYETGYRVGRAFSARNARDTRRADQYDKASEEERYTGKSPGKPPPSRTLRGMANYKAIDRLRDKTVDRYQRHTQTPRRGPVTRALQGRQTGGDYDKGVEDARRNYRQSRGSIATGEGPGGKDYIPHRVGAGDVSTGDLGKKIRFSMNRRSRRNPPEWSHKDKDIDLDKLNRWMDDDDEGEEWKKGKNNEAMENTNMKYNHDKILAESASLTLSDLEQLQSAPGPVTEARQGKKGSPKKKFQDEGSARRKEEAQERAQEHADDTAARDGGPYVARDIKLGHDQGDKGDIRGQGGSRQPKKERGAKTHVLKRLGIDKKHPLESFPKTRRLRKK